MGFQSSVAVVTVIFLLCIYALKYKSFEWNQISLDKVATSTLISTDILLLLRVSFATVIWFTIVHSLFIDKEGIRIIIALREKGKTKQMHILGFGRLAFFTYWSWVLEGTYFILSSLCSFAVYSNLNLVSYLGDQWYQFLIQLTWVLYQINFAVALLVTVIVTFVLIPGHKREGISTDLFFKPVALITHNANIAFMASEIIFNSMKFSVWHVVFAVLFGMSYVMFSWYWFSRTGVFFYFFLDYARDDSIAWYLGLCTVVCTS